MTNDEIKMWYAQRVPISGRLSDYALTIAQNNRVLQRRTIAMAAINSVVLRSQRNRISLSVYTHFTPVASAADVWVEIRDDAGNILFAHNLLSKQADVALVTPSPFQYSPLVMGVLDFGDLVQQNVFFGTGAGNPVLYLTEITMNPLCCEYIGGVESGSMEPQNVPNGRRDKWSNPNTGR